MLEKEMRWKNKKYTDWVATLPCSNCQIHDATIVAHHLKGRYAPYSGGAGIKASDWLTMPLCYNCHTRVHNGDRDILDFQLFPLILSTLREAFKKGILEVNNVNVRSG